MRLLVWWACLLGFAAAHLQQQAAIDECVADFLEGAVSAGSLTQALDIDDPEMEQMAEEAQRELGEMIRQALKEMLANIQNHVDNGKAVAQELLEKVKELRKQWRDLGVGQTENTKEIIQSIRAKAKEALHKVLEKLGLGKRNLDDSMDQVARMKFRDLLEKIREKILTSENILKIREHVTNHPGKSPLVKRVKEMFEKLSDGELKEIVSHLLEYHPTSSMQKSEAWDKIKDFFKDLDLKISEGSKRFGQWVKDMWSKGIDRLREKHGTIKAIAMEFIANAKDMSAEMSREALEFFRPYKDELGTLWNKIVEAAREAIGRF